MAESYINSERGGGGCGRDIIEENVPIAHDYVREENFLVI